jgi:L-fuculose-phosphate aldolase
MKVVPNDKETIKQRELARMTSAIAEEEWTLIEKVALACRILFHAGHDAGLSGQLTARVPGIGFVTQRLGLGFDEASVSNLLIVTEELQVVSGHGMPNPANRFHSWIYAARSDVNCIVHSHPTYTAALSMLEVPLEVGHTDSCVLHGEVAFLPRWDGVPVGNSEGATIAEALGDKKALLLGHHGLLTAASSVEEACSIALQFERAAQLQLLAMAAGKIVPVDAGPAAEAHDWLLQPKRVDATFAYYARRVLRADKSCLI